MKQYVDRHSGHISGVLSCFDRMIFKGQLPINYEEGIMRFFDYRRIPYRDFGVFVKTQSTRLKDHGEEMARKAGRPFIYFNGFVRKEDVVRRIREKDAVTSGLVCVLSTLETAPSYVVRGGPTKPRLQKEKRRCMMLYYYFVDPELGLIYVRVQTWVPFTIQVYLNGHDWLAQKMERHGIPFVKRDNCFLEIGDLKRAQSFSDAMSGRNWVRILDALARRVNPLMKDVLRPLSYYWTINQAEYATDIAFKDRGYLKSHYQRLIRHATLCLGAEDVLGFLGRKLSGCFRGEVLTEVRKRYWGYRVKHRMKANWMKMYDKNDLVLRIETVINDPKEFPVRRKGRRDGRLVMGWFPLCRSVAYLGRYREVAMAANRRYLDALAQVETPMASYQELEKLSERVEFGGRKRRGLNPVRKTELSIFAGVSRGEHAIRGFRNRDLCAAIYPEIWRDREARKKLGAKMTRVLQLLRAHRLIAKIPRTRRYRMTSRGSRVMGAALYLQREDYTQVVTRLFAAPPKIPALPA